MNTIVNRASTSLRIAGVDGCTRGWVVVTRTSRRVVARLGEVIDEFDVVGVDMPIGLPHKGPRACDIEARRFLSPRGSTVFPAPPRSLIVHDDYAIANAASKSGHGRGLSRQAFALVPKIRGVDELVRGSATTPLVEIHPECAFARMAGRVLAPKRSWEGLSARHRLVEAEFGSVVLGLSGAKDDDVLDAYAVLWSAERFARGEHVTFGGEHDDEGLPMRIVS